MQEILGAFLSMAQLHGLEVDTRSFTPEPADDGLASQSRDYEGGFVLARLTKTFSNAITAACRH